MALLGRVPRRLGHRRDGRGPLLTASLPMPDRRRPEPTTLTYRRLAGWALGVELPADPARLLPTAGQRAIGEGLRAEHDRPIALLCPGGSKPAKRWPAERFGHLARMLEDELGLVPVLTTGPGEADVAAAVREAAGRPLPDLADRRLGLGGLLGALTGVAVLVTNDTGPRHVAAGLGVPMVSLFGPTDHRWTTLEGAREHRLRAEPFLPEPLVADRHPAACSIDRIPVADVLFAVRGMLREAQVGDTDRPERA